MEIKVAFVPTAGIREAAYWGKLRLPVIFSWPLCKWFCVLLGCKIKLTDEFKEETVARLEAAARLYREGRAELIFVAGGWNPNIKPSVAQRMREYLIDVKQLPVGVVFAEDNEGSVQTSGNANSLVQFLVPLSAQQIKVWLCSSWYHNGRVRKDIELAAKRYDRDIRSVPQIGFARKDVWPPLTRECVGREYLFNVLSEPIKRLASLSPRLLAIFDKRERQARTHSGKVEDDQV